MKWSIIQSSPSWKVLVFISSAGDSGRNHLGTATSYLFIYLFFKTTINPTWNNCPPSSPLFPLCSWVICIPPQFQMFCFHSFFHFILFFFTHFHFPNPSLVSSHSFTSLKFTLESPRFGSCSSRWWPTTTTPGVVVAKWSSGTRLKINSFLLFKWV